MHGLLTLILGFMLAHYLLDMIVETLNMRHASPKLPQEFEGYYNAQKYQTSQEYLKERTRFGLVKATLSLGLTFAFILLGGFNALDLAVRGWNLSPLLTGLCYIGLLSLASTLISLPFSLYSTFVIEEKYGFNRTTLKTFVFDLIKGLALSLILGGLVLSLVLFFFEKAGALAWFYCWLATTVFQIVIMFVAPIWIMPLFNKFTALPEGELKSEINRFAQQQQFQLEGIYTMDGSKRSSKANAFFTGFGRFKRIVLFDTLIDKHSTEELVAVLAHEIGHYKKKHILKSLILSILTSAVTFYLLGLLMQNKTIFSAFSMDQTSIYASLVFFALLYSPVEFVLSIATSVLSRKNEYEADAYAAQTYQKPEALITALKKLSVDSLSNLTPHPLKVFLEYSHPPVLKRIKALRNIR